MAVTLGPFAVGRVAGRGSTARVWRGVHQSSTTPVALKALTDAASDRLQQQFAAEVRAVARLDHPAVIRLHDYGRLPPMTARRLGTVSPEAPYLVMEWIGGGTLTRSLGRQPWPVIRSLLLVLLDGLAHAHARGIVHRDLKPANVLLAARGPVLSDFGMAWAVDDERGGQSVQGGTPNYMAPEQIRGASRAFGPWTDLYALGCLTYALVCGRAPFAGGGVRAVCDAHLKKPLPPLEPATPVPDGLYDWIRRLCAKRIERRYALAADAAVALLALPEAPGPSARIGGPSVDTRRRPSAEDATAPASPAALDATWVTTPTDDALLDATVLTPPVFIAVDEPSWRRGPLGDGRPPFPARWAAPPGPPRPAPLLGVGRALFALQPAPLVGRQREQDALWAALGEAIAGDRPRAVVVRGPSGRGKTRLTEWLTERAAELGVALAIEARHGPEPGPGAGVAAAFARALRCDGADPTEQLRIIERILDRASTGPVDASTPREQTDSVAVAAALSRRGAFVHARTSLTLGSTRERHAALRRVLTALADRRPRVLVIDDAQWGFDALLFAQSVLEYARCPVLIVLAVREDALAGRAVEDDVIGWISERRGTVTLALEPLGAADQAQLIRARLPLDDQVMQTLLDRTGGNPMFGEELVRHWIQRGALEPSAQGYRLRDGADETLPEGLESVWWSRVREALAGLGPAALSTVEIAAVAGATVPMAHWQDACRLAGLALDSRVPERLLDARLLVDRPDGLHFVHAMVRETLLHRLRRTPRWALWHGACADALGAISGVDPEQRAMHLIAADRAAEAWPLLLEAIDGHFDRSAYVSARRALLIAARSLRRRRRPRSHPTWSAVRVRWSRLTRITGRPEAALRWARQAERLARAADHRPLVVRALLAQGLAAMSLGALDTAWPALRMAVEESLHGVDDNLRSLALCRAGNCLIWLNRFDAAASFLEDSLSIGDQPWPHADAELSLAELERRRHRLRPAITHSLRAFAAYQAIGSRWGMAQAQLILGDIERTQGQVASAQRRYAEASTLCEAIGSVDGSRLAAVRDALALIALDRFDAARRTLDAMKAEGGDTTGSYIDTYLLACHAGLGDWGAFDAVRRRLEQGPAAATVDPEVVLLARRVAGLARAAGRPSAATFAEALAREHAAALGWPTD